MGHGMCKYYTVGLILHGAGQQMFKHPFQMLKKVGSSPGGPSEIRITSVQELTVQPLPSATCWCRDATADFRSFEPLTSSLEPGGQVWSTVLSL